MELTDKPIRKENVKHFTEVHGHFIFDRSTGDIFQVNETAYFVWELCDGCRSIDDIANQVHSHYEVQQESALKDVLEFIQFMVDKGLIEFH